jgi:hypothetical protein
MCSILLWDTLNWDSSGLPRSYLYTTSITLDVHCLTTMALYYQNYLGIKGVLRTLYSVSAEHDVALYRGDKYRTTSVIVKGDNSNMYMTAIVKQTLFTGYNRLTVYTESWRVSHHIKLHLNMHLLLLLLLYYHGFIIRYLANYTDIHVSLANVLMFTTVCVHSINYYCIYIISVHVWISVV